VADDPVGSLHPHRQAPPVELETGSAGPARPPWFQVGDGSGAASGSHGAGAEGDSRHDRLPVAGAFTPEAILPLRLQNTTAQCDQGRKLAVVSPP